MTKNYLLFNQSHEYLAGFDQGEPHWTEFAMEALKFTESESAFLVDILDLTRECEQFVIVYPERKELKYGGCYLSLTISPDYWVAWNWVRSRNNATKFSSCIEANEKLAALQALGAIQKDAKVVLC